MDIKSLLDKLPFNGSKTWFGVILAALIFGFQQMGYIDDGIATMALNVVTAWTGLSLLHKDLKAKENSPS